MNGVQEASSSNLDTRTKKSSEICGFRNFFCAFCGTLESEEKVVHNACITAVKKVRKLGFEKVTFCNFFGERFRSVYKELHADHETGAADNK